MLASGNKIKLINPREIRQISWTLQRKPQNKKRGRTGERAAFFYHKSEKSQEHNKKTRSRVQSIGTMLVLLLVAQETGILSSLTLMQYNEENHMQIYSQIIRDGVIPGPGSFFGEKLSRNWGVIYVSGCKENGFDLHMRAGSWGLCRVSRKGK